jgi:O-antigen ligase
MQMPTTKLNSTHLGIIFFILALCSVWSIPHTIGIRYLAAMILIGLMIWKKPNLIAYLKVQPIFIALCIYLLIHIFFISDNLTLAIRNFNQEWLKFLIFTLLGASIGIYLCSNHEKDSFLWLGCAFSIPLIIHLALFLLKTIREQSIPFGYAGLSESHGDLGYTALQSSIFLLTYILLGTQNHLKKLWGSFLLFCCILSPYLAQSRGGLIFVTFSILLITTIFYLTQSKFNKFRFLLATSIFTVIICIFSIKVASIALPGKWLNMSQSIEVGFIGDPIDVMCNGLQKTTKDYQSSNIPINSELKEIIKDLNNGGTTARVTVARAGFLLLLENLMGLNGSKDAYEKAISEKCAPTIKMANTHNGWLDLALAIGLPGLFIFLMLYANYFLMGYKVIKSDDHYLKMAGFGALVTSAVWFFRGILDATSRDQMLEIQAFCLALFAGIIFSRRLKIKK